MLRKVCDSDVAESRMDLNIRITPSELSGSISAIPSKSYLHRVLICSMLADDGYGNVLRNVYGFHAFSAGSPLANDAQIQDDVLATLRCLEIAKSGSGHVYDCGESGATLRFLLPVLATFGKDFVMVGGGRLPERPLGELVEQLRKHGCEIDSDHLPINVSGQLTPGEYMIPGNISSQYISGLLFALPLLNGDSTVVVTEKMESEAYIEMTLKVLNDFGIEIERSGNSYLVKGNQVYRRIGGCISGRLEFNESESAGLESGGWKNGRYGIEGDWSSSAFWLGAGAFSNDGIACRGLDLGSLQPDKEILGFLRNIGAKVDTDSSVRAGNFSGTTDIGENLAEFGEGSARIIEIRAGDDGLCGVDFDASRAPDLVPVIGILLAGCRGESRIYNASRLRMKESDRLRALAENLRILGGDVSETADGLRIRGVGRLSGGTVSGHGDHRIVMAMAIASIICENDVIIEGSEAVSKSYPRFFDDFRALGGRFNVI